MQHHVAHHVARELQAADAQRPAVQGKAGHGTAELRAERFDLQPAAATQAAYRCRNGVTDGIRTHNNRNHNPGLYL